MNADSSSRHGRDHYRVLCYARHQHDVWSSGPSVITWSYATLLEVPVAAGILKASGPADGTACESVDSESKHFSMNIEISCCMQDSYRSKLCAVASFWAGRPVLLQLDQNILNHVPARASGHAGTATGIRHRS